MSRGAMASFASTARTYALPGILVSMAVVWQLFILPKTFPRSHYEVIGVKSNSSSDEIFEAYERLTSEWKSNKDVDIVTENVIEVQHAFEVLSNELRRRDYDLFNVDELQDIAKITKKRYVGEKISRLELPLLKTFEDDLHFMDDDSKVLTSQNFGGMLRDEMTWLIQVYSLGSASCQKFSPSWKRIVTWLDGVVNTGKVELGEVQIAAYLAERNQVTGHPFFRYGLPSLVAFPANCRNFDCLLRYSGELNVDAIVDWIATDILGLPRILYYSPEALVRDVIRKPAPHKVKVIFFSRTGHRAAPFLRQAAKDYQEYASFAFVLWQEENAQLWWNLFEMESAPAIVFLKDPGVKFVHYGAINSSDFKSLMEQHKTHALRQLRSITSMDLGCDPRGHSPAGNGSFPWYCVVIAGKPGFKLSKAREVLRSVQDNLTNEAITDAVDISSAPFSLVAAQAFKEKRLSLGWLDGVAQKKYCFFYLSSENVTETCGPRNYEEEEDVPKLFLVRYQRNISEDNVKVDKRFKPAWDLMKEDVSGLASQLVAKYNGSMEVPEILSWISKIIKEGDSKDLPYYMNNVGTDVPKPEPSITDEIPQDASQALESDTESEE
ncbi:uncharacterized protein LOC131046567 isoform X2 [Cryptomeria japonica]|uniref:uncharacterized protein LOC131046567 isoform X2 n=1 Tax=Cryptomeria japonica TaxID=3369 RepID=UPI0025ACCBEB|nr:uncharacterized protein LOC131046567 isoform X2 [Cryptomeria japonica]